MKFKDLIDVIEEIAPTERYREFDNSGVQIDVGKAEINKVLVCLEINNDIIDEAINKDIDLILTHHPLIFNPMYKIEDRDFPGHYVQEAIRHNISVYSAHLSFDFADRGNNAFIAELLDINLDEGGGIEDGYYGTLNETMNFEGVCRHVENKLNLPLHYIRCVDGGREQLRRVGLCTGAGGDYIFKAAARGCDLFITGDLRLHEAQYAKACGMSVIDAGHYGTEQIFVRNMARQLEEKIEKRNLSLSVIEADSNTNPYTI